MVKELLEEIKKAEDKAESNLENARYKAKYMLDKEKENCENKKAESRANQIKKRQDALSRATQEGGEYKHQKENLIAEQKKVLYDMAKEKEAEVIKIITEEIIRQ